MNIDKYIKTINLFLLSGFFSLFAVFANANEILGQWNTENGDVANIFKCETSFCIDMTSGKYKGKMLAKFEIAEDGYKGIVYNPAGSNEFPGTAKITGDLLEIKACPVAFFCKTQKWNRM